MTHDIGIRLPTGPRNIDRSWNLKIEFQDIKKAHNSVILREWSLNYDEGPGISYHLSLYTLRLRQNGHQFVNDIFKCIFLNENVWISIKISLKFVPKGLINNIPALVLIMAWHWPGNKPFSELVMVRLLMHVCITQPHWVKQLHVMSCCDMCKIMTWYWNYFSPQSNVFFRILNLQAH